MIRKYTEKDCEAIIDVWFTASVVATPFLSEDFLAMERERIRTIWLPKAETWVFEKDGNVDGFVSLIGNEIGAIFVRPSKQGNGIGRALMDHSARLREELFLDVFEENAIGRRFYRNYGFQFVCKHVHEETGQIQLRLFYSPAKDVSAIHRK